MRFSDTLHVLQFHLYKFDEISSALILQEVFRNEFSINISFRHEISHMHLWLTKNEDGECHLSMSHDAGANHRLFTRFFQSIDLFRHIFGKENTYNVLFNLGDAGSGNEICYCAADKSTCLVPDIEFLGSKGYDDARSTFASLPSWKERSATPYWRGSATGHRGEAGAASLPRMKLCVLGKALGYDTAITQTFHQDEADAVRLLGILAEPAAWADAGRRRYNIDIDGSSSAWSSLFRKLLAGGVVLKVTSPFGYRQWYYERLQPWENFVPVADDMSDLRTVVDRLESDHSLAMGIAEAGRKLALQMTYTSELTASCHRLDNFISKMP